MKPEVAQKILEKVKSDYQITADSFDQTRQNLWQEFLGFKKYVKKADKVLDLGCGNGRLSELFDGMEIDYVGIDNSQSLIDKAKNRYPNKKFITSDIIDLPFTDGEFDIIFFIATFHHIPSLILRQKVIKEVKRVLKPGGILIMTNWNLFNRQHLPNTFKYFILNLVGLTKMDFKDVLVKWKKPLVLRYYHAFTKREIARVLKNNDFKIIKNYWSKKGEKDKSTIWFYGRNIVTIAKKC
jgi:ubiquinone/menaquinone biosynthesis C-methylase UbiE